MFPMKWLPPAVGANANENAIKYQSTETNAKMIKEYPIVPNKLFLLTIPKIIMKKNFYDEVDSK